jgi:hypothetical protein
VTFPATTGRPVAEANAAALAAALADLLGVIDVKRSAESITVTRTA